MEPVGLTQLVLSLLAAVGVGNFVIVILVLFIVVNAPTIIGQLIKMKTDKDARKASTESSAIIKTQLIDIKDHAISAAENSKNVQADLNSLTKSLDELNKGSSTENNERREENVLITGNLVKMSNALDSIDKMMRNVMSEKDMVSVFNLKMGINNNFKNRLLAKIMETIEPLEDKKDGQLSYDLKSDLTSLWSDVKNEFETFNVPMNIKTFLDQYDEQLWSQGGMFQQITNLAISSSLDKSRKREAISRQIDLGTRSIQSKISCFLEQKRRDNFR